MHLLIPHASALGDACAHTLGDAALPNLAALLGLMKPGMPPIGSDEYSACTPAEQALAALRGGSANQPAIAAWKAQAAGLDGRLGWALLTPIHLAVGSDQISAHNPADLQLDAAASQALFAALSELWPTAEGWHAHWLSPTEWLIAHESLAGLRSASLDRVIARSVDAWMPEARRMRTLQNEAQMLLHHHPLNDAREALGLQPVNSVWISGSGSELGHALPAEVLIDERLRAPLLAGDWAAWAEAWAALDAGPVAAALARAQADQPVSITLCGERLAQTFSMPPRGGLTRLWQRLATPRANTAALLIAL
ncbi:hypothetical protein BH11PSE10_BH11PSE10_10450 [soil metagenome]